MMLLVLLIAGFVAVAAREQCCIPAPQFEMVEGMVTGYKRKDGRGGSVTGALNVAFDGIAEKVAVTESLQVDGKPIHMKVILDYRMGVSYIIRGGHCNVTRAGKYQQPCLPEDAKLTSEYDIGSPNLKIPVNSYLLAEDSVFTSISMTKDCYPVGAVSQGEKDGVGFTATIGYLNIKDRISDMSVFDVPPICPKAGSELHKLSDPPESLRMKSLFVGI